MINGSFIRAKVQYFEVEPDMYIPSVAQYELHLIWYVMVTTEPGGIRCKCGGTYVEMSAD